jgi:His/Glu/Gln/Arg/opine family amino acid ABC transporter permease subunit
MKIDPYLINILAGAGLTLVVGISSLMIATALGLLAALAKLSAARPLRMFAQLYSGVVRGVPDLVLMLLVFYGGQIGLNQLLAALGSEASIDVEPLSAGILTIGFIYGAYLSEIFRGAILAIPVGQAEAAEAFGMSRWRVTKSIVAPQMVRFALPGFTNTWLVLVKATALVSIIGLNDMMYRAKQASGATQSPFIYFLTAGAIYLVITSASLLVLKALEHRFSRGVRRASA